MKYFTSLLLMLFSLTLMGQSNLYPDTLARDFNTSKAIVIRDCNFCDPIRINEIIGEYYFDIEGLNSTWYGISEGEKSGKQIYNYVDGVLYSYENYGTWTSEYKDGDFDMKWDSAMLTNTVKYEYGNNKIKFVKWLDGAEMLLSILVSYTYNENQQIESEKIQWFSDGSIIGEFLPNSDELISFGVENEVTTNQKKYHYTQDTVTVKYFSEEILTATEVIISEKDKDGIIRKAKLTSTKGELLLSSEKNFNSKNQLLSESKFDSGYDGFGNSHDVVESGIITYEYNNEDRLKLRSIYSGEELLLVERYYYQ